MAFPRKKNRKRAIRSQRQENVVRESGYIGMYSGQPETVQVLKYEPKRLLIIDSMSRDALLQMLVLQMQQWGRPVGLNAAGDVAEEAFRRASPGNSPAASTREAA
jgi:hypothetical protein